MKIVPEISLRHDLQYYLFISTPTIDIEPFFSEHTDKLLFSGFAELTIDS